MQRKHLTALLILITPVSLLGLTALLHQPAPSDPPRPVAALGESSSADLSLAEQRAIWNQWHADIRIACQADNTPANQTVLAFLEKNGSLWDTAKGKPPRTPDHRFHIVVLDSEPHNEWEKQLALSPFVFAQYDERFSSLAIKDWSMPAKIRGSIGFHEAIHAFHFKTKYKILPLTGEQHYAEELSAYKPQLRQIRAMYAPEYEPLRRHLIALLSADVHQNEQRAENSQEAFLASIPTPTSPSVSGMLDHPEELERAFQLPFGASTEEVLIPFNFAFMDAAFAVIEQNFPNPQEAALMEEASLHLADMQMGQS